MSTALIIAQRGLAAYQIAIGDNEPLKHEVRSLGFYAILFDTNIIALFGLYSAGFVSLP